MRDVVNARGWPCGVCEYIATDPADRAAHIRGYHPADPRGVTAADHGALRARHAAEEAADGVTVGLPAHHVDRRVVCHGCGARVFRFAAAASGRHYCPTCTRRITGWTGPR